MNLSFYSVIFTFTGILLLLLAVFTGNHHVNANLSSSEKKQYHDLVKEDWIISGDNLSKFFSDPNYKSIITNLNDGGAFIDLKSVSYSVGNNFLNATLLLDSNLTKMKNILNFSYGMRIDVDSDRNTGWNGWDFMVQVSLNNNSLNRRVIEIFPDGVTMERQFHSDPSFSGLSPYSADIYLDLNEINKPSRFTVAFEVANTIKINNTVYHVSDASDWFVNPPFVVNLEAEPIQFDLHAGDSRDVEWSANSQSEVHGVTSFFVNDIPVSMISPYFSKRGINDQLVENLTGPDCYQSVINSDVLTNAKKFRNFLVAEGNDTPPELRSFAYNISEKNDLLKEVNMGQVDGLKISRSTSIDDFSTFDTFYHSVKIQTFENASRGLTYLTIRTNVFDPHLDPPLDYYYSPASSLGPEAFSRCMPKYSQADLGQGEIDVRINVLPPKDSFKKLNDFLRNYDILVTVVVAFISGGIVTGVIKWRKMFSAFHKIREFFRNRYRNK